MQSTAPTVPARSTRSPSSRSSRWPWRRRREERREALELYIRAVELQPKNSRTWFELGRFELDAGLRDPGIRHLLRSRELDRWGPSDATLRGLGL